MAKFSKYITNVNGQEYIANYKSVSATQLAARMVVALDSVGIERVRAAAFNSYGDLAHEFIALVRELKEQRV